MNHKKMTAGILMLMATGALAVFYWLEFFPSKYTLKLVLMLLIWLVQLLSLLWLLKLATATIQGGTSLLYWILGGAFAFGSLLYCIGSTTPSPDRELIEALVVDGKRLELYHLDRYDHTALEVFCGSEGWLAQRYVRDHFTVEKTERIDHYFHIKNSLQVEEIQLNLTTMEINRQAGL